MTKGSLNCRHKGWEREKGMGPVRGDYDPPLPATHPGDGCAARPGTAVNLLRARKEIDTAAKGGLPLWMGFQFVLAEREPYSRQQCLYTHTSTF